MPKLSSEVIDLYAITDGVNTIKSGIRIDPTELRDCQNIRYFPVGGFKWREGYSTLGDAPNIAATGIYMARFSSGTNAAIRIRGSVIEYMSALNGTWINITGAVVLTSGADNTCTFAMLNDIVIVTNGVDNAFQINSSLVAATVGALPSSLIPTAVYEHRGYMFYVTADRLFFSSLNVPATVLTNNYITPGSRTGGNIIGGVDFQGKSCVFKRHGIFGVEFQPTRINTIGDLFPFIESPNPIVPGVGTQSHRTIVKFTTPATHRTPGQELVFFLDQFGVPRLFDGSTSLSVGTGIADCRDDAIVSLSDTNKSRLANTWAINDAAKNLIYLFVSSTGLTQNDVCWILDYTTAFAWGRDSYLDKFNCGAIFEDTTGVFRPYFANYAGQVFKMGDTQADNGTAIISYATTGDMFRKSPVIQSSWQYLELRGATGSDTQTLRLDFYVDGEDSPSSASSMILYKQNQVTWDSLNWDSFNWVYNGLTTKSAEINLEAKSLRVKFSNSTLNSTCVVEGASIFVKPEGWKQES